MTHNAAEKPRLLKTELSGILWPREAVELFAATADAIGRPSIGTAVVLNEWMGQREGDVLRMPRGLFARRGDGTITVRQSKTRAVVNLPIGMVPSLVARVEGELARLEAAERDRAAKAAAAGEPAPGCSKPPCAPSFSTLPPKDGAMLIRVVEYLLTDVVHTPARTFRAWVPRGTSAEEVIDALLLGYQPPGAAGDAPSGWWWDYSTAPPRLRPKLGGP